jgi:hypothetical protein
MRPGIALALLVLLTGCGTLEGPRTGTISPPTDALARWQDFPADRVPRPIVLLTSFQPKCAKLSPTFQASTQPPPQADASWSDGTVYTFAAISEADAIKALNNAGQNCATVAPLPVTAGRFGTVGFRTDRGLSTMSAWLFAGGGAPGEIPYPALAPSAFWGAGAQSAAIGGGATFGVNGRVLTYSFPGGPPDGPCAVDYTGVVAESSHAVAVAVQSNPGRPQAGPITCDVIGRIRSVTVQLASALAGRVLVDASGAVVEACPETIRAGCP